MKLEYEVNGFVCDVIFVDDFFSAHDIYSLNSTYFFVIDDEVYSIYEHEFLKFFELLRHKGVTFKHLPFSGGEKGKGIHGVLRILNELHLLNFKRNDTVVAIGGGTVLDVSGFAASIFKRGTKLYLVPTTLLSMVDSAFGGKTGINFKGVKNLIGTFFVAQKVLISIDFLKSMPEQLYKQGFGEIIKYGLIYDFTILERVYHNKEAYLKIEKDAVSFNEDALKGLIAECVKGKHFFVKSDLFDANNRKFLNFGHTIAHGVEAVFSNRVPHGIAVSFGILFALYLSGKIYGLSRKYLEIVTTVLKKYSMWESILEIAKRVDIGELVTFLRHDKKRTDANFSFVLLPHIEKPVIYQIKNEKQIALHLSKFLKEVFT